MSVCKQVGVVIFCQCGKPSSHYGTMGVNGAREVREEAPPIIEDEDGAPISQAMQDVIAERSRQISEEGWTPEHDDQHIDGSLAAAAACYALAQDGQRMRQVQEAETRGGLAFFRVPWHWPSSWHALWWKPTTRRRDLVKAAALLVAEIERLDRLDANDGNPDAHDEIGAMRQGR